VPDPKETNPVDPRKPPVQSRVAESKPVKVKKPKKVKK